MTDASTPTSALPAGWYPDQADAGYYRWWDGLTWTEHRQRVQPEPAAARPQLTPPPAPPAGAHPLPQPAPRPPQQGNGNAAALSALILGVIGILIMLMPYVGLAAGVLALIFGIVGVRAARAHNRGRGPAIAGIAMGGIATFVGAAITLTFTAYLLSPDARDAIVEPTTVAESPAIEAPSTGPADEDNPAETPAAADPTDASADAIDRARFVRLSGNDLDDIDKDLDDMIVTLDEAGFWRLLTNSIELSFNHAQLTTRDAPAEIADPWKAGLATLEETIAEMDDAITDERNDDLRALIDDARGDVQSRRDLLAAVQQ